MENSTMAKSNGRRVRSENLIRNQAFDVFRFERDRFGDPTIRCIDTVFYSERPKMTAEEVRRSLVEHDGYPVDIMVRKVK
jgi:hypothetical protein